MSTFITDSLIEWPVKTEYKRFTLDWRYVVKRRLYRNIRPKYPNTRVNKIFSLMKGSYYKRSLMPVRKAVRRGGLF